MNNNSNAPTGGSVTFLLPGGGLAERTAKVTKVKTIPFPKEQKGYHRAMQQWVDNIPPVETIPVTKTMPISEETIRWVGGWKSTKRPKWGSSPLPSDTAMYAAGLTINVKNRRVPDYKRWCNLPLAKRLQVYYLDHAADFGAIGVEIKFYD